MRHNHFLRPQWTPPRDALLRRLRIEGATWAEIALVLRVSRDVAIERGRRIGAPRPPRDFGPSQEDLARPPLAAGDVRSWSLLTAGTCLEGQPYTPPSPVR
jgi:hypothetical protein